MNRVHETSKRVNKLQQKWKINYLAKKKWLVVTIAHEQKFLMRYH